MMLVNGDGAMAADSGGGAARKGAQRGAIKEYARFGKRGSGEAKQPISQIATVGTYSY